MAASKLLTSKGKITFTAKPYKINGWTIIRLPKRASAKLSSRGQAMVKGKINGISFQTALEPDGMGSHWFKVENTLIGQAKVKANVTARLEISPLKVWPEPVIPNDILSAIASNPKTNALWQNITTMARWEWLRWIRATGRSETRQRRIEVACSKLNSGMRRPCCWNRNTCSEPSVSKNGVLLGPNP
ncbi:MAG: YdeI/OmpD-associated family protein [Candidatus Saccharimonadales bacterium]